MLIDQEFIDECHQYIGFVREQVELTGGTLYVEVKVPIDHITGEHGATGTADAVIYHPPLITVMDAKFGRGKVNAYEVMTPEILDADGNVVEPAYIEPNSQLAMYASGALRAFDLFGEVERVRMIIVQPKLNHVSEYAMEVA